MEPILDTKGKKIKVKLTGIDGNAFSILGACNEAMKAAGVSKEIRTAFYNEATSGDYDNLLQTAMRYFEVK